MDILRRTDDEPAQETIFWGDEPTPRDFLDGELTRIKDIGQEDAVMLFSSASDEISAERRDDRLSVMTHFLLVRILDAVDEDESLTLEAAFEYLETEVPRYMDEHYPGRPQTPQLVGDGSEVRLR